MPTETTTGLRVRGHSKRQRCYFERKGMRSGTYLIFARFQLLQTISDDHPFRWRCDRAGKLLTKRLNHVSCPRKLLNKGHHIEDSDTISSPQSQSQSQSQSSHLKRMLSSQDLTQIEDGEAEIIDRHNGTGVMGYSTSGSEEELEEGEIDESATSHIMRSQICSNRPAQQIHQSVEDQYSFTDLPLLDSSSDEDESDEDEDYIQARVREAREKSVMLDEKQNTPRYGGLAAYDDKHIVEDDEQSI